MKPTLFGTVLAAGFALAAAVVSAPAQNFPTRPVT